MVGSLKKPGPLAAWFFCTLTVLKWFCPRIWRPAPLDPGHPLMISPELYERCEKVVKRAENYYLADLYTAYIKAKTDYQNATGKNKERMLAIFRRAETAYWTETMRLADGIDHEPVQPPPINKLFSREDVDDDWSKYAGWVFQFGIYFNRIVRSNRKLKLQRRMFHCETKFGFNQLNSHTF